jgi:hypothetical protein
MKGGKGGKIIERRRIDLIILERGSVKGEPKLKLNW